MVIRWNEAHLIGQLWGLKGNAQDVSDLVKTIMNEYESQSKDSQEIVRNAIRKYADKNNITESEVYECLEKVGKKAILPNHPGQRILKKGLNAL